MRNLLKYPVTAQEKLDLLTELRNDILWECRIGDMRPLLLKEIAEDVAARAEARPAPVVDREAVARVVASHARKINRVIASGMHEREAIEDAVSDLLALLSPATSPGEGQGA